MKKNIFFLCTLLASNLIYSHFKRHKHAKILPDLVPGYFYKYFPKTHALCAMPWKTDESSPNDSRKQTKSAVIRKRDKIRKKLRNAQTAPEYLESPNATIQEAVESLPSWTELNVGKALSDPSRIVAVHGQFLKAEEYFNEAETELENALKNLSQLQENIMQNSANKAILIHAALKLEVEQNNLYVQAHMGQIDILLERKRKDEHKS